LKVSETVSETADRINLADSWELVSVNTAPAGIAITCPVSPEDDDVMIGETVMPTLGAADKVYVNT
jgi:hypothetical protein